MGAQGQKQIALLIFALSPEEELQQKSLSGEKGLYALLNQHTLSLAKSLGIPYFHFTEKDQVGNNFGERYTNAIKKVFSQGYDGIITIGNDTPGLSRKHLKNAYSNLLTGKAVLGPSLDGGFYLLAIPKSSFSEQEFLSISWKTAHVFRQMRRCLQIRNEEICLLNSLGDLDVRTDVAIILDHYGKISLSVKKILRKLRLKMQITEGSFLLKYVTRANTRILNRGSPTLDS